MSLKLARKFTYSILVVTASSLLWQPPINGKSIGQFYCRSNKSTSPISKASIRSTATGFSLAVESEAFGKNPIIFEISKNLEIQKYGFPGDVLPWREMSNRKPDFSIRKDGSFNVYFLANGCGQSSINGKVKFINNARLKLFNR
jgi:hypothetical protein